MKKVININFQGRVIPIEESAYDILKQYVESLRAFFANEEGRDEIINDIEGRIAELFSETLKKGVSCIADDDVSRIIDSMGRPQDFDEDETRVKSQLENEQKQQSSTSSSYTQAGTEPRRLYRDENNKFLGGVCSGLANYFGIDPVIVRVLFVIGFFGFGIAFIPYIILWIAVPSSASTHIGSQRKRLFRDPDDRIIGGVCSGLANYFALNVWIPRLLFLVPFFAFIFRFGHWRLWDLSHFVGISFSPGATFVYIVLWIVLPEARSTADRLEMKGEKVDLNNIKNTIQGDMEGFKDRAQQLGTEIKEKAEKFGQEFGQTVKEKSRQFRQETASVTRRSGRGVGDIIVLFARIFAYFILGSVLFGVVASLFAVGVVFTGFLPARHFLITDGWEDVFAWGTLLLFIWVPVIGIVTWIIRRIAKMRGNSALLRSSFIALWVIGLICFIGFLVSLKDDFRYTNHPEEQNIALTNPRVSKLELTVPYYSRYYNRSKWLKIEPFASFDDDSVFVQNVSIRIIKSNTDSFKVVLLKLANGPSKKAADETVSKINYSVVQKDTMLELDKGIALTATEKFRNQHLILTVAVPVGKKILVHENVGWDNHVRFGFGPDDNEWNWYDENYRNEFGWKHNVEYVMTEKGLKRTNFTPDDDENNDDGNNAVDQFRKSKEQILKEKEQKLKELQQIDKELQASPQDSIPHNEKPRKAPSRPKQPAKIAAAEMPVVPAEPFATKFSI